MTYKFEDRNKPIQTHVHHFGRGGVIRSSAKFTQRVYTFTHENRTQILYFTQHTTSCATVCIEEFSSILSFVSTNNLQKEFPEIMETIFKELYSIGIACILYTTGESYYKRYKTILDSIGFIKYLEYWNKQHSNNDKQVQLYKVLAYDNKPL